MESWQIKINVQLFLHAELLIVAEKINARGKKGIGEPWKAGSAIIPIYKDSEGYIDVVIFKICSILSTASKSTAILQYVPPPG